MVAIPFAVANAAWLEKARRQLKPVYDVKEPCGIDDRTGAAMAATAEQRLIGVEVVADPTQTRRQIVVARVANRWVVTAYSLVSCGADQEARIATEAVTAS